MLGYLADYANAITACSYLFAIMGVFLTLNGKAELGTAAMLWTWFLDHWDGHIARKTRHLRSPGMAEFGKKLRWFWRFYPWGLVPGGGHHSGGGWLCDFIGCEPRACHVGCNPAELFRERRLNSRRKIHRNSGVIWYAVAGRAVAASTAHLDRNVRDNSGSRFHRACFPLRLHLCAGSCYTGSGNSSCNDRSDCAVVSPDGGRMIDHATSCPSGKGGSLHAEFSSGYLGTILRLVRYPRSCHRGIHPGGRQIAVSRFPRLSHSKANGSRAACRAVFHVSAGAPLPQG
ncbi:hypothetical protein ABIF29_001469 [Bradyrhizobium elkanii]|uniref:CDP-alcohol phosphatidyltransferase family protein n=1 Tax=Bradyrhizobium elkanii TaxID=29448 RepID=A0ABV4EV15_BRAEL